MAFALPPLPFAFTALEPHIDEQTMQIHHGKHHQTYVNNLNAALEGKADLEQKGLDWILANLSEVPEAARTAVRNNGGGHHNHTLFWEIMTPGGPPAPEGELAKAIDAAFGGLTQLKEQFQKAALGRFGSGWAWVTRDRAGKLAIESTPNQDSPVMDGKHPVLGCDVWEHAYYLKYQNRRPDYVTAWWNVVNWKVVGERLRK